MDPYEWSDSTSFINVMQNNLSFMTFFCLQNIDKSE
jgi:hypothetical protein